MTVKVPDDLYYRDCELFGDRTNGLSFVTRCCYAILHLAFVSSTWFDLLQQAGLGEDTEIGSGLIVSCIVGGAIVTPLMGAVSDFAGSIRSAYIIPMLCFAGVLVFSHRASAREDLEVQTRGQAVQTTPGGLKAALAPSNGAP